MTALPPGSALLAVFVGAGLGACGGLTTFSTYSAEVVNAFSRGEAGWALVISVSHLAGSLLLTLLGLATVRALITP